MTQQITITVDNITLRATLNDSPAAQQIGDALPITGKANVWGDEIYFGIPLSMDEADDARAEVEVGALAFWPPGNAFCIFYGPTPVSKGQEPRAYSPVNVFGHIEGDATQLRGTRSGAAVRIEWAM
ncbi:MAG: cyclophilin-like fold protein [Caldilineaceae bacterium]